ncbi:MAG: Glycosyl transferase group 1 [candidate division WWE3 bacterium GW2011_GWF2_41_45]|uniref:Glycosyl transferase family 1 domain-containing protein n=3 Tax=Katanobacteria TaxID=422282 RepID=A0A1F4W3L5_UNCKA|nr:MAG: Glycosyl transferase group 1 [candidate division WWE3 bacterium GW2011_GWC2_41_23]KKS10804.1 MAG: Glycosyl transferase group 1 [candidate division WWE3 bacterium GW2011_GWF2_41_45]KKS12480.1 MAG: Glycosyl transferase group 1 [candidate division WWE3 bacterium GW2011_GWF1_41_53]KKS20141.1 MAG: Glycosyl transferase group 1 [candidate division WWE3 bacterium GW2011_GWE1_41_72]KKS28493.1 MAG: Glycosyl transferase group 1 [candidate division WWE3 bacterium GW2011_GWC1_42_102]KKS29810.1 MAG:
MIEKKVRILLITPFFSPNVGGVESFLTEVVALLRQKHVALTVITYQPLIAKETAPIYCSEEGLEIIRLPWPKFGLFYRLEKHPILQFFYLGTGLLLGSIVKMVFSKRYSTVLCHGMSAAVIGVALKKLFSVDLVTNIHTNYRFVRSYKASFLASVLNQSRVVLALSQSTAENLKFIGVKKEIIQVFYNWINEENYYIADRQVTRKKLGIASDFFVALFVGRFSVEKGIYELVDALPDINRNIKILIVGGGKDERAVYEKVGKFENASCLGYKTAEELKVWFNAADILIYASMDEDYLGRVAIESLFSGLPIMSPKYSNYSGKITPNIAEIPSDVGLYFENGSKNFATSLNKLYESGEYKKFDRDFCRQHAIKKYGRAVNSGIYLRALGISDVE